MHRVRFAAIGLVVCAASCGLSSGIKDGCHSDTDCNAGRVCSADLHCVDPNTLHANTGGSASGLDSGGAPVGEAGMGADSGEGGAAGSSEPTHCQVAADCDDHDPCNGDEKCSNGACTPGQPFCTTQLPNCTSHCTVKAGKASCALIGVDHDGDGFPSVACAAAPGSDCDDEHATVYPNAPEICDGLDNDCNGLTDVADGLKLSGVTRDWALFAGGANVAWSKDQNTFGVTWYDDTHFPTVLFSTADPAGTQLLNEPLALYTGMTSNIEPGRLRVAPGPEGWAVTYVGEDNNAYFQRIDTTSALAAALVPLGSAATATIWPVVEVDPGTWLLFHGCCEGDLTGMQTVSTNGTLGALDTLGGQVHFNVGVTGKQLGVAWQAFVSPTSPQADDGRVLLQWTRLGSDLSRLGDVSTIADIKRNSTLRLESSVLGGGNAGYAVAYRLDSIDRSMSTMPYVEFAPDGSTQCGPIDLLATAAISGLDFQPVQMIANDTGYLMVSVGQAANNDWVVEAIQVRSGCQFVQRFEIERSRHELDEPSIASSPDGYLAFWRDVDLNSHDIAKVRGFGPLICQ